VKSEVDIPDALRTLISLLSFIGSHQSLVQTPVVPPPAAVAVATAAAGAAATTPGVEPAEFVLQGMSNIFQF
jgi:hypothetical protein